MPPVKHEEKTSCVETEAPIVDLSIKPPTTDSKDPLPNSAAETLRCFEQGQTPEQIAEERQLQISTIYGHLEKALLANHTVLIERLLTVDEYESIEAAYKKLGSPEQLRPIYEELDEKYEFGKIRLVLAFLKLTNQRIGKQDIIQNHPQHGTPFQ